MFKVNGIHHITAIAGRPSENVAFYTHTLGMRMVKKSVNQDDPGTYHLFYGDGKGNPGTGLTFFPWVRQAPGSTGNGMATEVALAVPQGSLDFWLDRLDRFEVQRSEPEQRFGARALSLRDPHGLQLALVEAPEPSGFAPWKQSTVPQEHQIRGFYGVRLQEAELEPTRRFLVDVMGFEEGAREERWQRFQASEADIGRYVDVIERPDQNRGSWGVGAVHHVAYRVSDDEHQLQVRRQVQQAGHQPTQVIDRFWFKSVYFTEPGQVLFELATDGPGYTVDEDPEQLGQTLILPPWLEAYRNRIEQVLPPLEEAG